MCLLSGDCARDRLEIPADRRWVNAYKRLSAGLLFIFVEERDVDAITMGIEDVYQSVTEETPQPIQASITGQLVTGSEHAYIHTYIHTHIDTYIRTVKIFNMLVSV